MQIIHTLEKVASGFVGPLQVAADPSLQYSEHQSWGACELFPGGVDVGPVPNLIFLGFIFELAHCVVMGLFEAVSDFGLGLGVAFLTLDFVISGVVAQAVRLAE